MISKSKKKRGETNRSLDVKIEGWARTETKLLKIPIPFEADMLDDRLCNGTEIRK